MSPNLLPDALIHCLGAGISRDGVEIKIRWQEIKLR